MSTSVCWMYIYTIFYSLLNVNRKPIRPIIYLTMMNQIPIIKSYLGLMLMNHCYTVNLFTSLKWLQLLFQNLNFGNVYSSNERLTLLKPKPFSSGVKTFSAFARVCCNISDFFTSVAISFSAFL